MSENYITCDMERGSINISEDVVSIVAAAAISEVDGVGGLSHSVSTELSDFLGKKNISKGIKVNFTEDFIAIDIIIMIRFGFPVATVAEKVQKAVALAVEAMTGMDVPVVNVHVSGVVFDK